MKKIFLIILITITTMFLFTPVKAIAMTKKDYNSSFSNTIELLANPTEDVKKATENYDQDQNCNTLLGNPEDEDSVAWLVQKILNYVQIIGPLLVVILSSIDFAQVIIKSDDDAMAKATKKLTTRLILAASLFFLPILVKVLLSTFGITSDPTCGIK